MEYVVYIAGRRSTRYKREIQEAVCKLFYLCRYSEVPELKMEKLSILPMTRIYVKLYIYHVVDLYGKDSRKEKPMLIYKYRLLRDLETTISTRKIAKYALMCKTCIPMDLIDSIIKFI